MIDLMVKHYVTMQSLSVNRIDNDAWYKERDKSFHGIFSKCPYKIHYAFRDVLASPPRNVYNPERMWCQENLEGNFAVGIEFKIGRATAYGVCFELESDLLAFKLRFM